VLNPCSFGAQSHAGERSIFGSPDPSRVDEPIVARQDCPVPNGFDQHKPPGALQRIHSDKRHVPGALFRWRERGLHPLDLESQEPLQECKFGGAYHEIGAMHMKKRLIAASVDDKPHILKAVLELCEGGRIGCALQNYASGLIRIGIWAHLLEVGLR
jgi:hypothetical protein